MTLRDAPDPHRFRADLRRWLADARGEFADRPGPGQPDPELWREWSRRLYNAGWVGLTWPTNYGGRGLGIEYQAIYLEEMALADALPHMNIIGLGFAGPTILNWGTEEQKSTLVPKILSGEEIWSQGFSEPGSGSDLASVRTRGRQDGGEWVVSGQKIWSSWAHVADRNILLARTDPDAAKHEGLSMLLLDLHQEPITVRPLRHLTGDAEFNEVYYDDARCPVTDMLGKPGEGWAVAMTTLRHERGTAALGMAVSLEVQLRALRRMIRELGLGVEAEVRSALADAWIDLRALQLTNYRLLSAVANNAEPGPESSIAKLAWSETNQRITRFALECLGTAGIAGGDGKWSAYWQYEALRARGNTIEGGSTEILSSVVAERVLALPRAR